MVEPVKLSTLYDPQGKWTGRGQEPQNVSAPEGQEAYFTPGQQIQAPHSGIARAGMQWSDKVRHGYDPWTGAYPGEGTYRPGAVSYRDIPTPPAPIQQVQNLIPGAAATAPVTNSQILQQQAQEKANAQLTGNLFPTFNQPAVAPTTPAVAPTTPAVAPQPTMAQPTIDPGDAERYRRGIFGARPVDQYGLDPLNPFFYLPGQRHVGPIGSGGPPPIMNRLPGQFEPNASDAEMWNMTNNISPDDPNFRTGPYDLYSQDAIADRDANEASWKINTFNPFFYMEDPNDPTNQLAVAKSLYPDPSTAREQALADMSAGTKDFRTFGEYGMPRRSYDEVSGNIFPKDPQEIERHFISDWYDPTKYAGGGEVLDRPMFANGGPVNPPVDPQNTMNQDLMDQGITNQLTPQDQQVASEVISSLENTENFEDVINLIRGDERPMEERKSELAEVVGPEDAKKTPDSSLTIAQFGLKEIEEHNKLIEQGEMQPEGIGTLPPGTDALAADQGALMGGEQMPQVPEMMQPPPQMAAEGGMIPGYANGGIINALPHFQDGGPTGFQTGKLYQRSLALNPLYTGAGAQTGMGKTKYEQELLRRQRELQGLDPNTGLPKRTWKGMFQGEPEPDKPYTPRPTYLFTKDYSKKMQKHEEEKAEATEEAAEELRQEQLKITEKLPEDLKARVIKEKSKLTADDKKEVEKIADQFGITKKQDLDSIRKNVESLFGDAATQTAAIEELAKGNMEIMQKFAGPNKDENTFQLGMLLMKMGLDIGTSKEQNLLTNIMESGKGLTQGLIVMGAQAASDRKELGRTATLLAIRQFEDTKTPNMRDLDTLLRSNIPWDVALERVFPSATDSVYNDSMKKMIGEMFLPEWQRISAKDEYKDNPQGAMNEFMDKFERKLNIMDSMLSKSLRGFNIKGEGRRDAVTTDYGVEDAPLVLRQRHSDDYTGLSEEEASAKADKDYANLPKFRTKDEILKAAKEDKWEIGQPFLYGNDYKVQFYNPTRGG